MSFLKSDPHSLTLHAVPPAEVEPLLPLLRDALPDEALCRACMANPANTLYAARQAERIVGAAVMQWGCESELHLLAAEANRRGQGIGQAIVAALLQLARQQSVRIVYVGTVSVKLCPHRSVARTVSQLLELIS